MHADFRWRWVGAGNVPEGLVELARRLLRGGRGHGGGGWGWYPSNTCEGADGAFCSHRGLRGLAPLSRYSGRRSPIKPRPLFQFQTNACLAWF